MKGSPLDHAPAYVNQFPAKSSFNEAKRRTDGSASATPPRQRRYASLGLHLTGQSPPLVLSEDYLVFLTIHRPKFFVKPTAIELWGRTKQPLGLEYSSLNPTKLLLSRGPSTFHLSSTELWEKSRSRAIPVCVKSRIYLCSSRQMKQCLRLETTFHQDQGYSQ